MSKVGSNQLGSIIASLVCIIAGCGSDGADHESASLAALGAEGLGTLTVPLQAQVGTVHYRLDGASLTYSGPVSGQMHHNGSSTLQYAIVPAGDYLIELADGWELTRDDEDTQSFVAVEAELVSANPRAVRVEAGGYEVMSFMFETDGTAVPVPPGTLQVNLGVIDRSNFDEQVFGDILLDEQDQIEAYAGVVTFGDALAIMGPITSLLALEQANTIRGGLTISATELTTLAGLNNLGSTGRLEISGNASLTSLSDLQALSSTGDIVITSNPSLPTCEAEALIAHITETNGGSTGNVEIWGNDDAATCP